MKSFSQKYISIAAGILCALLLFAWWFYYGSSGTPSNTVNLELPTASPPPTQTSPSTATPTQSATGAPTAPQSFFLETDLHFEFGLPGKFTAYEYPPGGNKTVIVVGDDTGRGMLIQILPIAGSATTLSEASIKQASPDTPISNARQVSVVGTTGVEFASTNQAFGGPSIELWFIHKGNLYQLSVHPSDEPLLKTFTDTWVWM